ncbi:ATP-binding protein [Pelosinus sp. sgz500959]|uniref:sensor histidine kinase n=1 Tax=Pelosinus sp. sgz500959 TaxID=3242472 RepID=UPI00367170CE
MTVSLRTKLFIILSGLILFFVFMSLGLTRIGLEKFYIWQKKDILIASSTTIDDLYRGNPVEIALELERVGNTLGTGIIIFTKEGHIKYTSFSSLSNPKLHDPFPPLPHMPDRFPLTPPPIIKNREVIDNQTVLEVEQDPDLKIDFMILKHQLKNEDILILKQPLAPVFQSVTVAAQFIILTGILFLFAGCMWAFYFAKKFTHPIIELNRIAQSMSQLNFSQKCIITRSDELGALGKSINHLSDQLDAAISELSEKNQQLMADVEKERTLDKMRKDFISSVSHELKTPLSLILGYAEGLKENIPQDEDGKNYYCSVIIDEAEKMDRLVKDLLNLSQIESGFFQLNKSNFDISLLLNRITLKYLTILSEKNITLEMNTEKSYLVHGDILRIEQVVLNLFNNAIDHTEFAKIIKISLQTLGDYSRVSIYNSGRSIPEESLEKIWTSFYKVDKSRTRERGGYGLGLSIVRAIQELHASSYGVENVEGGVRFWFDINNTKNKGKAAN